ncbi:two-component regulator propeller domain-containing protein [Flavobacteriaceae bacterium 3-367]
MSCRNSIWVPLLLCIGLLMVGFSHGQDSVTRFRQLGMEDGLSQSSITCILKDRRGFMWFGTEDGLNRYDGTDFTVFRPVPNEHRSISNGYINALVEDTKGTLWVGTKNGLNRYDPERGNFTRYLQDTPYSAGLDRNCINSLQLGPDGQLLVGTWNGLYAFKPNTGFAPYKVQKAQGSYNVKAMARDDDGSLWVLTNKTLEKVAWKAGAFVPTVVQLPMEDPFNSALLLDASQLWIGSSKGLIRYNLETHTTTAFPIYKSQERYDSNNIVLSIQEGSQGTLWLGTGSGGLVRFDKTTQEFSVFGADVQNRFGLNSDSVKSLLWDDQDILWVGTFGGGINIHDTKAPYFQHYYYSPHDPKGLSENSVRSIFKDSEGALWVGTHGGLNRFNTRMERVKVYEGQDLKTSETHTVRSLCEDVYGGIWAGTWLNGLIRFDTEADTYERYFVVPGRTDSIRQVRAVRADNSGNIWFDSQQGLWQFNPKTKRSKNYPHREGDAGSLTSNGINYLYFDATGNLWIGTQNGLNRLDPDTGRIKRYLPNPSDPKSLSHKYVTSIVQGQNGAIWVGTYGGGLDVLDPSSDTFGHYNTGNGLLNDVVYGVLIDNNGFVWFSTNTGLGKLDPNNGEVRYYRENLGVQGDEFNAGAYFQDGEGAFFFGGTNGFNQFYANAMSHLDPRGDLVFTDFRMLEGNGLPTAENLWKRQLSSTRELHLDYTQTSFSLKFSELNYSDYADHAYEYQLQGAEGDWQSLGKEQWIHFSNLASGTYVLHVRIQNDPAKEVLLPISIATPPWRSNWAYTSYALLAFLLVAVVYRKEKRMLSARKHFEEKIRDLENDISAPSLPLKKIGVTSSDQRLLEQAIALVEKHMENSDFSVEAFTKEMCMSRSQLHRKLKSLTGFSATEFIRMIRLKRAAQLLKGNVGTVGEVAYKVGFDHVGYFSKCFKETFGIPPSQYKG